MQKIAKYEVFGHFLKFGASDGTVIAYYQNSKCFSAFGHAKRPCIIDQVCIISIKRAKNIVFDHFLVIGLYDCLEIAHCDSN